MHEDVWEDGVGKVNGRCRKSNERPREGARMCLGGWCRESERIYLCL